MRYTPGLLLTLVASLSLLYTSSLSASYAQTGPTAISVEPFKSSYSVGTVVTIIGEVSGKFTAGSSVAIKVKNPTGQVYKDTSVALDSNGAFSYAYDLKGTQAEVIGTHTIDVTHQTLKATATFEVKEKASITVGIQNSKLNLGDMVVITGTVTPRLLEAVEIKIYNPENKIWKFYAVSPDKIESDGTFSAEVGELSGKLSVPGKYKAEISYAGSTAKASLEFNVSVSGKVTPGRFMMVDQVGAIVEEIFVGQAVLAQADIRNNQQVGQPFTYFVLITDSSGFTISLSWLKGTLPPSETLAAAQSWIPASAGSYIVKIFVWKSVTEPEVLGRQLEKTVRVVA